MKLSRTWLQDFITLQEADPQRLSDVITAHTAEVDAVTQEGELLDKCCVGKVLTVAKHPDADRLLLCDVQTDDGTKRVVCGGTNLREGMRVAFAHTGAQVKWHGTDLVTLEPVKIRGEKSEGMICACEELGLETRYPPRPEDGERPIVDFGDGDDGVGQPLREYLGMTDVVFHVDNHSITHRADLFSQVGFARELVAAGAAKWKQKPVYALPKFPEEPLPFTLHVDCPDLVPRYAACLLEIDELGETPDFIRHRIEAVGWRSVNLPVDITNFVCSEIGMPLHSFDADDLRGDIRMRTAKAGEKITTLDEVERELPEGALVLSDDDGIFDLLGVMGGLRSSTKDTTRRIFLHSAAVDPVAIRRTIVATGHRTDAATVYEKGIPPVAVEEGFARAIELILKYVPGAKIVSARDTWGEDGTPEAITLSPERVCSVLGVDLKTDRMVQILESLEFSVAKKGDNLQVKPPLHRIGDITGAHDLYEEIGRIYGYNEIEPTMPQVAMDLPARDFRVRSARLSLRESGFTEILPLAFIGPDLLRKAGLDPAAAVEIANPIGEELSLLQPCLLPHMLEHAADNILLTEKSLLTFTVGSVFANAADKHRALGLLATSRQQPVITDEPLLQVKAAVLQAAEAAGYTLSTRRAEDVHAAAHPGRSAELLLDGTAIGQLFEVHPQVCQAFDLPARSAAALLNLTALLKTSAAVTVAEDVPEFPGVHYDETITLQQTGDVQSLLEKARQQSDLLTDLQIADLYAGKSLEDGQYNLTLSFTYRAADRTLKEDEAKQAHQKVMKVLTS